MAKDLTGTTLGKYQIMERLGRGGMADVYRAYQPGMDRIVALKIMHGHLAEDSNFVTRFKREAHSVGNLRHPNIVQVIDFDVQDEEYYMVMEFIQGDTLKALLQTRGALPITEALDITIKLADALAYAHAEGMIHRDIKPANILFGKNNTPILTDFGIARIMDASGLTVSGMFVGTPSYTSPEAGRGEAVDGRADIYSLGIVLYEMLTGAVPFDADTPYAVILKHINDPLPTPRQFNTSLPEVVERVVLKALAKDKEDRFQTAAEFKTALENAKATAFSEMPTRAGATLASPPSEEAPAPRSSMIPLAVAGVVVVVVIVGVLAVLSNRHDTTPPATPTNVPVAAVVTTVPTVTPTSAPVVAVVTTASATQAPATQAATAISAPAGKYAALTDQVKLLLIQGSPDQALTLVEAALKGDPQSYDLLVLRGRVYVESGPTTLNKALSDAQAAIKIDPKRPDAYLVQGQYYTMHGISQSGDVQISDYKQAIPNYTQAISLGSQDYYTYWWRAGTNMQLNGLLGADKNVPDSDIISDYDKAISFAPRDVRVYEEQGHFYFDRSNYPAAQKSFEQVLTIRPDAYDVHPYLTATYLHQDLKQKAYDLYVNAIEKDNFHDNKYLADGAYIAWVNGKPDKANEWIKLALSLDPDNPTANYDLAMLAWDSKNYDEALKQLDVVLKTSDASRYGFPYFNRAFNRMAHADHGRILADAGKLDEAVVAYNAAIQEDQYWPELYIELAKIYIKQGKNDDARQNLRTALDNALSQKDESAQKDALALLDQLGSATLAAS